jgi:hypothetical protein
MYGGALRLAFASAEDYLVRCNVRRFRSIAASNSEHKAVQIGMELCILTTRTGPRYHVLAASCALRVGREIDGKGRRSSLSSCQDRMPSSGRLGSYKATMPRLGISGTVSGRSLNGDPDLSVRDSLPATRA